MAQGNSVQRVGWICIKIFCFPNSPTSAPLNWNSGGRKLPLATVQTPTSSGPRLLPQQWTLNRKDDWLECAARETVKQNAAWAEAVSSQGDHTPAYPTRTTPICKPAQPGRRKQVSLSVPSALTVVLFSMPRPSRHGCSVTYLRCTEVETFSDVSVIKVTPRSWEARITARPRILEI